VSISAGNSHTLVATAVREVMQGEGTERMKVKLGGEMYQAGPANVLGKFCPKFERVDGLDDLCIQYVAAGFTHSACVAATGELFCWGNNEGGCCGAPENIRFLNEPFNVRCLYERPVNIALGKPAKQSSVYSGLDAYLGVDGNTDGSDPNTCLSTQLDPQAWWEVDLGDFCVVHKIKIWNRTDSPPDPAFPEDMFQQRLFPCFLMLAQEPYSDSVDIDALPKALNNSVARMKLTKCQRCTTWHVPENIAARYMRVQLEGMNFLHFAQVEIFGTPGINKPVGRCGHVQAGKSVTLATIRPLPDPKDVEKCYKRAVLADPNNANILRQYETFALEYDKFGHGEGIKGCMICKGGQLCELHTLRHVYMDELKEMPLGLGGRQPGLKEIIDFLVNAPKPPLDYEPPVRDNTGGVFGKIGKSMAKSLFGTSQPGEDEDDEASGSKNKAKSRLPFGLPKGSAKVDPAERGEGDLKSPDEVGAPTEAASSDNANT